MGRFWQPAKLRFLSFFATVMVLLPMAAVLVRRNKSASEIDENSANTLVYNVYDIHTDTVISVPVRDYLIGAVAAEMPASYESEALKAQVVASHTYAERICMQNHAADDETLHGADFSNDSTQYQAYLTEAELKALWGSDFARNYAKITDAVDAVGDLVLYYEDVPIVAAFHAVSAGQTSAAEDVWGTALPYLVQVHSPYDKNSPQYEAVTEVSANALRTVLETHIPGISLSDDASKWLTESGDQIVICAEIVSAEQLREMLLLPSACFRWTYDADHAAFVFTSFGCGHNVGMSQFGANEMAKNGSTYDEILAHYYPGTTLRNTECSTWNITAGNA